MSPERARKVVHVCLCEQYISHTSWQMLASHTFTAASGVSSSVCLDPTFCDGIDFSHLCGAPSAGARRVRSLVMNMLLRSNIYVMYSKAQ